MREEQTLKLDIELWLDTKVDQAIQESGARPQITDAVAKAIGELMADLGIPGLPQINLRSPIPDENQPALVAVQINGQRLTSAPVLENRLLAVIEGRLLHPGEDSQETIRRLSAKHSRDESVWNQSVDFLALLARSIVGEHPETLLNQEMVALLRAQWSAQGDEVQKLADLDTPWLTEVLSAVLEARLTLINQKGLIEALLGQYQAEAPEAGEAVIAALLPGTIGLQIPRSILRGFTEADERLLTTDFSALSAPSLTIVSANAFIQMEKQIFADLGLSLPPLEFEVTDLQSEHFLFRINGMQSPPWPTLPAGKLLVDATPETLETIGIEATDGVLHPVDGRLCCLVATKEDTLLATQDYRTWNGIEYLALCLASQLRAYKCCLVHSQALSKLLDNAELNAPELVKVVRAQYANAHEQALLVRTLRALVHQQVSMVHLPGILDSLLETKLVKVASEDWTVVGDAMPVSAPQSEAALEGRVADPDMLAMFIRHRLNMPVVSLAPSNGRKYHVGLEEYAEPTPLQERLAGSLKRYSSDEIKLFTYFAGFLTLAQGIPDPQGFFADVRTQLLKELNIAGKPLDETMKVIIEYFQKNPLNAQLIQDLAAEARAEVPHNADGFTAPWRSKYEE